MNLYRNGKHATMTSFEVGDRVHIENSQVPSIELTAI